MEESNSKRNSGSVLEGAEEMKKNTFALFIYHKEKRGHEKWQYRKEVKTGNPDAWLTDYFEKIYNYKVKGGTFVACLVKINGTKFKSLYVVYGGGYEMCLAKR